MKETQKPNLRSWSPISTVSWFGQDSHGKLGVQTKTGFRRSLRRSRAGAFGLCVSRTAIIPGFVIVNDFSNSTCPERRARRRNRQLDVDRHPNAGRAPERIPSFRTLLGDTDDRPKIQCLVRADLGYDVQMAFARRLHRVIRRGRPHPEFYRD